MESSYVSTLSIRDKRHCIKDSTQGNRRYLCSAMLPQSGLDEKMVADSLECYLRFSAQRSKTLTTRDLENRRPTQLL